MKLFPALLATLLLGLAPVVQAQSNDTLNQIAARIDQHAVIRADFSQSKQVAGMKRPLQSSGKLIYAKAHGVLWQIEQPYRMSYILTEDKVVEIAADGSRRERNVRDLPGLAQVGRVFRAMLGANASALREYFDVQTTGDAAKWEITLKPRQPQLAQFLEGLQVGGGQYVNGIRINEAGGDRTQIQFSKSSGSAALTTDELLLFTGAPQSK